MTIAKLETEMHALKDMKINSTNKNENENVISGLMVKEERNICITEFRSTCQDKPYVT